MIDQGLIVCFFMSRIRLKTKVATVVFGAEGMLVRLHDSERSHIKLHLPIEVTIAKSYPVLSTIALKPVLRYWIVKCTMRTIIKICHFIRH